MKIETKEKMKKQTIKDNVAKFISSIQKKLAPGEHSLTIAQACKKWPESKSRAFTILNGGDGVYFMIDDWPEYYRQNEKAKVISSFDALKILPNGQIFQTKATIHLEHTINAITFEHFANYCQASIIKIKDSNEYSEKEKSLLLKQYEELLGFKTN